VSTTSTIYTCLTCKGNPQFGDPKDMFAHLRETHNITSKPIQGTKQMSSHMDSSGWFSTTYDIDIEGIKLISTVVVER